MDKLKLLIAALLLIQFIGCSSKEPSKGIWRGEIQLNENAEESTLPFIFEWNKNSDGKDLIIINNADEKIKVDEITFEGDSVFIKLPIFKDEIRASLKNNNLLSGSYLHVGSKSKYSMPFKAVFGDKERFKNQNPQTEKPLVNVSGRWKITVEYENGKLEQMVGEFVQDNTRLTATFLTTTGDFRYLEGIATGEKIYLSAVDGNHTILIKANVSKNGELENGLIIGGPKWRDKWTAKRDEEFKLPDATGITKIKEGTGEVNFTFTDLSGKRVSISDDKYKGKPVIVQLMGSWCPNCMDETRLFNELYEKYNPKGLQIIGLCFETNNFEESKLRIERFVKQLGAKYDFLYAGEVGSSISETLPFIEKINGYPTTLYLDKEHKIVKVYTGFSGPGTGKYYLELKEETIKIIESLL